MAFCSSQISPLPALKLVGSHEAIERGLDILGKAVAFPPPIVDLLETCSETALALAGCLDQGLLLFKRLLTVALLAPSQPINHFAKAWPTILPMFGLE